MLNKLSRELLVLIASVCVIALAVVIGNAYADINATKLESALTKNRVDTLENRFDKFEDKLDRIGERLGVKA